jgi:hypothetical protein
MSAVEWEAGWGAGQHKMPSQGVVRFAVAAISALATGFVAHESWPGSVMAVITIIPLALLVVQQLQSCWTQQSAVITTFTVIAWCGIAIEPGALNLTLFWLGIFTACLAGAGLKISTLSNVAENVLRHIGHAPVAVLVDTKSARTATATAFRNVMWLANLLLPILAVAVFGTLLAVANPTIGHALANLPIGEPLDYLFSWSTPVTLATFASIWLAFRAAPRATKIDAALDWIRPDWHHRYFKLAPIVLTLTLLNAMFAVENLLDVSFIWSGLQLPDIYAMKDYVHRGAYSLIVTALLAAVLIIAMFQPGSATERSPLVRALVYLWTAQNVMLVASSAKRVLFYVDSYGMTLWRLSSLIWMGLVGFGLILIATRIVFNRSNVWLLNTNLAAALAVLLAVSPLDLKAAVANWNAQVVAENFSRVNEVGPNDLSYDASLGPSALPALRSQAGVFGLHPSAFGEEILKLASEISVLEGQLNRTQSDWRTWTLRNMWIEQR